MSKNLIKKIINDEDLKQSCLNFTAIWGAAKLASMASSALFGFNLNKYNSIDHLAIGVGIGTLAYRKAGGGVKGIIAAFASGTFFNICWESFENGFNPYRDKEALIDSISDVAVVYTGNLLGILGEKAKDYINRNKIKRNEKWVI